MSVICAETVLFCGHIIIWLLNGLANIAGWHLLKWHTKHNRWLVGYLVFNGSFSTERLFSAII